MKKAVPFNLTITVPASEGKPFVKFLRKHILLAHCAMKSKLSELSIALVGDKTMSDLHERFMDLPGPTDVLTFPLDTGPTGRATSGEVVICVPEARRRTKQHGTDLRRELLLYAVHGMLHLDGWDDQSDADFRAMHRAEDQILIKIGVGPVFHHGR